MLLCVNPLRQTVFQKKYRHILHWCIGLSYAECKAIVVIVVLAKDKYVNIQELVMSNNLQFGTDDKQTDVRDEVVGRKEQKTEERAERTTQRTERKTHRNRNERTDGRAPNGGDVYRGGNRMMGDGTPSGVLGRTFNPGMNDVVVDGLAKKLTEQMENVTFSDHSLAVKTRFRPVSSRAIDEDVSGVMAYLEFTQSGVRYLAARIILCYVGESAKRKHTQRFKGETIEIPVRAADAANQDYWDKAISVVLPTLDANVEIISAGMETLTSGFDFTDAEQLELLLGSTITAIEDVIEPVTSGNYLDGVQLANDGYMTKVTPIISDDQFYNLTGQPIRGDIQLPWISCVAGQSRFNEHSSKDSEYGRVMGYIDLEPLPVANGRFRGRSDKIDPCYDALFVITHCGPATPVGVNTLEAYMNILSGAFLSTTNYFWSQTYQPAIDSKNSMRALAGLGWNTPDAAPFDDMDSASTTQRDVQDMLDVLLTKPEGMDTPTPAFAIDLDPSQDKSGVVSTLLAAGNGNLEANRQIVEAVDNYFGGHFLGGHSRNNDRPYWNVDEQVLFDTGIMISVGEWTDAEGVKRDSREYDTQALLNLLDGEMELFWDYMDTFDPNNGDPQRMMLQRERILNNILGNKLTFTSYAFRNVFDGEFFVAMNKCANDLQIAPRIEGVDMDMGHRYTPFAAGRQVKSIARSTRGRRGNERNRDGYRESSAYGFRGRR